MSSERATKEKRPVLVADKGIARQIPAVTHIVRLPVVGEIAAAGRAAHREFADRARPATRSCSSSTIFAS